MADQEEEKGKPGIHPFVSTTKSKPINKNIKTETTSENSSEVFLGRKPINLSKSQYFPRGKPAVCRIVNCSSARYKEHKCCQQEVVEKVDEETEEQKLELEAEGSENQHNQRIVKNNNNKSHIKEDKPKVISKTEDTNEISLLIKSKDYQTKAKITNQSFKNKTNVEIGNKSELNKEIMLADTTKEDKAKPVQSKQEIFNNIITEVKGPINVDKVDKERNKIPTIDFSNISVTETPIYTLFIQEVEKPNHLKEDNVTFYTNPSEEEMQTYKIANEKEVITKLNLKEETQTTKYDEKFSTEDMNIETTTLLEDYFSYFETTLLNEDDSTDNSSYTRTADDNADNSQNTSTDRPEETTMITEYLNGVHTANTISENVHTTMTIETTDSGITNHVEDLFSDSTSKLDMFTNTVVPVFLPVNVEDDALNISYSAEHDNLPDNEQTNKEEIFNGFSFSESELLEAESSIQVYAKEKPTKQEYSFAGNLIHNKSTKDYSQPETLTKDYSQPNTPTKDFGQPKTPSIEHSQAKMPAKPAPAKFTVISLPGYSNLRQPFVLKYPGWVTATITRVQKSYSWV